MGDPIEKDDSADDFDDMSFAEFDDGTTKDNKVEARDGEFEIGDEDFQEAPPPENKYHKQLYEMGGEFIEIQRDAQLQLEREIAQAEEEVRIAKQVEEE